MDRHALLVDTHAHLDHADFDADRDEVIGRAHNLGVSHILTVGCDLASSRASVSLAERFPYIHASVGVHPHDATEVNSAALAELAQLARHPKVVAIGEIGLDFYRDRSPRDLQRQAFRDQIRLGRDLGLPLIIHDRDAHQEILTIMRQERAAECGGVLHCFSGDLEMARACLDLGFYLSFPGTVTYPKNDAARDVLRAVPVENLLLETDCPYLSPQSRRGRRNEPSYIRETAAAMAEVKGLSLEDIARITTLNAMTLFGLGEVDQTSKIAYRIRNSLYLNITNRCTNTCIFCPKFTDFMVKGHHLRLDREPTADEVIRAIGDPTIFEEVVFCGYGEPLIRLDLVTSVVKWLKEQGVKVRVNTDGQGNLVHGRNILPDLAGLVDELSVSLNASDGETYQRLCQSRFGAGGFEAVTGFLGQAPRYIPSVTATAVTYPGLDIEACRRLATELGVNFKERDYNEVG